MDKIQCIKLRKKYLVINTDTLIHKYVSFNDMKKVTEHPDGIEHLITQLDGKPFERRLIQLSAKETVRPHLLPSYDCNYSCTYCYENGRKHIKAHMEPEYIPHVQAFYNQYNELLHSNITLDGVRVSGGEPFLPSNRPVIQAILSYWKNKRVSFITNGTYINEYRDLILLHPKINLSVSIDGTKSMHYQRRIPTNRSEYDTMIENVIWALSKGLSIDVSSVFHPEYVKEYPSFFDEMEQIGWLKNPQLRISFFLESSGEGADGIDSTYLEESIDAFLKLKEMDARACNVNANYLMPGLIRLIDALDQERLNNTCNLYRCDILNNPNYAFMPDGSVRICSVCNDEIGNVGWYWPEVKVNVERILELRKRRIDQLKKCKDCSKRVFCGGGCAVTAISKTHEIDGTHCGIWENPTFFEHFDEFLKL